MSAMYVCMTMEVNFSPKPNVYLTDHYTCTRRLNSRCRFMYLSVATNSWM